MRNLAKLQLPQLIESWQERYPQGWRPRHRALFLIIVGISLAVSATAILSYTIVRGLIINNLKQNVLLEVRRGRDTIDQWLSIHKTEIETIANTSTVETMNWSEVEPYLKEEQDRLKNLLAMFMVKSDGSYQRAGGGEGNVKDRPYFQKAMAGKINLSDPLKTPSSGKMQVLIASPIWSTSSEARKPIGVLTGSIGIERLASEVNAIRYGSDSYAFALNSEGVPIIHPNKNLIGSSEQPAPSFLQAKEPDLTKLARQMIDKQSDIELLQINGKSVYVAYVTLDEANWSIALVVPRSHLEKELSALNLLAIVLGGLLGAAMLTAIILVKLFEKTRTRAETEALLNRLTGRIRASLNLDEILDNTVEELGTLLHLERASFGWYDYHHQTLELCWEYCSEGLPEQLGLFYVHPSGDFAARLQRGESVRLLPEVSNSGKSGKPIHLELKDRRYLAIPIRTNCDRQGYLLATAVRRFGRKEEIQLLQAVADQLAIAITQSHLYTQTQEQVKLLDTALTELKRTQAQLVQNEKMSSLGQLVAGIAHEINNPVNFIYGNLSYADDYTQQLLKIIQLYSKYYPEPIPEIEEEIESADLDFLSEDLPRILDSMKQGAERIRLIVLSLRNFSRLDEGEKKEVDIHEGIDNTLLLLQNRLENTISVVKKYSDLPKVECYPGQLNQVFMNLFVNAIDALSGFESFEKVISVKTQVLEKQEGQFVVITIGDTGPGITPEIQPKIFDPFFTTKPVGKGTGMGLAISYQIVTEVHGGKISACTPLSGGTEVKVEIPISSQVNVK
ncbi:ATP-binding protein [Phormidium nigroviride]